MRKFRMLKQHGNGVIFVGCRNVIEIVLRISHRYSSNYRVHIYYYKLLLYLLAIAANNNI